MMLFNWKNTLKIVFIAQLVIACFSVGFSQEIIHRNYDALQGLNSSSILQYGNGDFAVTGNVRFYINGDISLDPMIFRADSTGNLLWANAYEIPRRDYFSKTVLLPGQKLLAIGGTESYGPAGTNGSQFDTTRNNILVAIIDSSGNTENVLVYGDTLEDSGTDILLSETGDLILLAMSNYDHSLDFKIGNMLLARFDTSLNILMSKEFYFGTGIKVVPNRIVESGGNFYVSGIFSYIDSVSNWSDAFLLKIDQNFNILWSIRMGSNENYIYTRILPHPNNGIYLGFSTTDYGTGFFFNDFVIANIDSNGNAVWSKRYGATQFGADILDFLFFNSDSTKIIIGSGSKYLETDLLGNIIWTRTYTSGQTLQGISGLSKSDGGMIVNCINHSTTFTSASLVISDSIGSTCSGGAFAYPATIISVLPIPISVIESISFLSNSSPVLNSYPLAINLMSYCETATPVPDVIGSFSKEKIVMYPNPASEFINFQLTNINCANDLLINIKDEMGRNLIQSRLETTNISLENLKPGCYFVEFICGQEYFHYKLVKL
jgi:hypothetical protein